MKNAFCRFLSILLLVAMLANYTPALALFQDDSVELVPVVSLSETILVGDYFYIANDSTSVSEDSQTSYLFTVGRGGAADASAEITVLFRDFTAFFGKNYTAAEFGGSEAVVPEGHMSYVDILADADSYEEYPLLSEEEAEQYLLDSAEEVENYLKDYVREDTASSESGDNFSVTGNYADNPLARAHAEASGHSLNRIPAMTDSGTVMVNKETGEVYGGETGRDPESLVNSFEANNENAEQSISANDTDSVIPPAEIVLSFAPGERTKQIEVTPIDCDEAEGDAMFMMALSAPSEGMELSSHNSVMITVVDSDIGSPAEISFADTEVYANGDTVSLTVLRSGAINKTVSAMIYTEEEDADGYVDFSPLGAQLVFPFGVKSRTVEIPVNHIRNSEVAFLVKLSPEADCVIADDRGSAEVTISPCITETKAVLQGNSASGFNTKAAEAAADNNHAVDLSTVSIVGSGYYSGDGYVSLTTHGIDNGVYSAILMDRSNDITWRSYAYDGFLIRWRLDEGFWLPYYKVFMDGKINGDVDRYSSLFCFNDDNDEYIDSLEDFAWTPVYFGVPSVYEAKIGMVTSFGSGNDLLIDSIVPIRREFHVKLLPAQTKSFRNVSDVVSSNYTNAVISDQQISASGERYACKYVGDSVSITATDSHHYLMLSGVELCKEDGSVLEFFPNKNTASDTFTLELTQDFIDTYGEGFSYENNEEEYTQSVAGNNHALIGKIYLRPRFSYRDTSLIIQADENGRGGFEEFPDIGEQYGWHMGDVVKMTGILKPEFSASAVVSAVDFIIWKNMQLSGVSGSILLSSSGKQSLTLSFERVTLRPVTTERDNALVVTVAESDYEKLDHSQGIFAAGGNSIHYNAAAQQYEITVVPEGSLDNGVLCSLTAEPVEEDAVCVWTEYGNDAQYSGKVFYHTAGSRATENVVRLSVAEAGNRTLKLNGFLYYSNVNINTSRSASAAFPAVGQLLGVAGTSAIADERGYFETDAFLARPGTWVRYLTASNGNTHLSDVYIGNGSSDLSLGMITVPSQSFAGVTVDRISVEQNGYYLVQTIPLGGVKATLRASVTDHVSYSLGDETLTENIQALNFVVLDGLTLEKKASFIAHKSEDYEQDTVWIAETNPLTPENSTDYAAGDYLYVELETDRRVADFKGADEETEKALSGVVYSPQYSGFTFISTDSYEPVLMEIAIPLTAENILSGDFKSFFSPEESAVKRKFVTLPFIGALDTQISAAKTKKDNLAAYYPDEDEEHYGKNGSYGSKTASSSQTPAFNFTITVEKRPNGVSRLKIGAAVTYMNSQEEMISQERARKFSSIAGQYAGVFERLYGDTVDRGFDGDTAKSYIYNSPSGDEGKMMRGRNNLQAMYGGKSMTFSIQGGFYVDFGLVSEDDSAIGAHFILLGLGGYLGFVGSIGYTQYFIIPVISAPGFIGFTGSLAVMGSLGGTGDPEDALNYDAQESSFVVNSFCDNLEATLNGIISLTGFLGIGIRGFADIRGTATLTFSVGMDNTYPDLYENCPVWGLDLSLALGMVIDFIVFSIPFQLGDWDLWQEGFYEYFSEMNNVDASLQGMTGSYNTLGYSYQERTGGSDFTGGKDNMASLQATFAPDSRSVDTLIADNIYSHPATKLLALENGKMLMAFLDDDPEKADNQITSLYISVYDGNVWSDPVRVQNDTTGDFTPNLTDCGNRVLISWVSAPDDSAENDLDLLMDLEVYTAFFDKATETISTPERLTDDIYYDSNPTGVYDEGTGSIALFYTKNAPEMVEDGNGGWHVSEEVHPLDIVNGLGNMTYSQICYRLYNSAEGGWITEYYQNEYPDGAPTEVINQGERYLNTEVSIETDSGINTDPVVTDFCAAPGYNGLAVFSYVIDMDNNYQTDDDREIFLQVYDFAEHRAYHPTRLTKNDCADTLPQLVRGNNETRLFWLAGNTSVSYVNVTDILRYGLNADGSLKTVEQARLTAEEKGTDCDILYHKVDLRQKSISDETDSGVTDFVALTDNEGNMYVIWGNGDYRAPADSDSTTVSVTREIYAAGMIKTVVDAADNVVVTAWSEPVKLTDSGCVNDCIAAATDSNNRLMLAANRYKMAYNSAAVSSDEALSISPMQLVTVSLAQMGSVEVTQVQFSDLTPLPGEKQTVSVTVKNTGLTAASGYSLTLSEMPAGGMSATEISSLSIDEPLLPGCESSFLFNWTAPQQFEGYTLTAVARENGFANDSRLTTAPLKAQAVYSLELVSGYQNGDDFCVDYSVRNSGNAPSASGDEICLTFVNLYGRSGESFGFAPGSDEIVARSGPLGLDAGEKTDGTLILSLPKSAFDPFGFIDLTGCVVSGTGEKLSFTENVSITQTAPTDLTIGNNGSIIVNGTAVLQADYNSGRLKKAGSVIFTVEDSSIASVSGNNVTALKDGETTLTATLLPYGKSVTVPLITFASAAPAETENKFVFEDVRETDYYYDAVKWAVENGITTGTDETHFSPDAGTTRGQIVTFLYRAYLNLCGGEKENTESVICPFTDVYPSAYYYEAVLWAVKNGITKGTSQTEFSPDMLCTRAQMGTFLYRFYQMYGSQIAATTGVCPFVDVDASQFYYDAVLWASANEITKGTSETEFSPDENVTRGQTVTFLNRYFMNLG